VGVGVVVGVAGSATFLYLFYIRYYKWRDCFNELGRCYDPDGSLQVYTTAGRMWLLVSVPFFFLPASVPSYCSDGNTPITELTATICARSSVSVGRALLAS